MQQTGAMSRHIATLQGPPEVPMIAPLLPIFPRRIARRQALRCKIRTRYGSSGGSGKTTTLSVILLCCHGKGRWFEPRLLQQRIDAHN
jgi:hypothetical protein